MIKIGCDLDNVLNNLTITWVDKYNKLYNDNITVKDITSWEIHKLIKPECGKTIYDLIDNDLLKILKPLSYAQKITKLLQEEGHKIFIVTATQPEFLQKKVEFLYTYFPHINLDNLIVCKCKSLVNVDVLIDDNNTNIEKFPNETIIFDQPWNQDCKRLDAWRAKDWVDVKNIITKLNNES